MTTATAHLVESLAAVGVDWIYDVVGSSIVRALHHGNKNASVKARRHA